MNRYLSPPIRSEVSESDIIYLDPFPSIRYTFRPNTTPYLDPLPEKMIRILSSKQMVNFIENYAEVKVMPHGFEGVMDWKSVMEDADGLEFKWYKPYWRCHSVLRNAIESRHLWEWYCNIHEPSGFVWSQTTTVLTTTV